MRCICQHTYIQYIYKYKYIYKYMYMSSHIHKHAQMGVRMELTLPAKPAAWNCSTQKCSAWVAAVCAGG